jgi:hypothetical protein
MLGDVVIDASLNHIKTYTENFYLLSAEPTEWADIDLYKVGVKETPTFNDPEEATGVGRKITMNAITNGLITADDTVRYYALTDDSESKILAAEEVDPNAIVVDKSMFTFTEITITLPRPGEISS